MQWCASLLHRCHLLVPPESLQLDLFVTNFNPPPSRALRSSDAGSLMPSSISDTSFSSATPASIEVKGVALDQDDLIEAQMPDDDYVDLSYYMGDFTMDGELGHEEHRLDLTNFDGDNDDRVRGESTLNRALKKEGTVRRAITRKKTESRRPKRFSGARVDPRSRRLPSLPTFSEEASQPEPSPPLNPWRALLLQRAMPLDGTMRLLLNLRISLYNLLTLRCHTRRLLSNWISHWQYTRMGTRKVLNT
jgi:hypothetical protein